MGVYLLTDERDAHPSRVDVTRHADPAKSEYYLELNGRAPYDGVYGDTYFTVYNRHYDIRFPGGNRRTAAHTAYARDYIGRVSEAIRSRNWEDAVKLIDVDSFVDFYIVQELFKNPDAHAYSVFMTIRGEGDTRRLYMGPTWDFDLAAGNRASQLSPHYLYVGTANYWYRNLMETPEFFDAAALRWNEIKSVEIAQMVTLLHDTAMYYRSDFERNFERHDILGVPFWATPPQMAEITDFMGQAEYLIDWLNTRVVWLDDFFNKRTDHVPLQRLMEQRAIENDGNLLMFPLHGVMMVETEGIAAAFGLSIEYDPQTQMIVISRGELTVTHRLFSAEYAVQDENGLREGRLDASSFTVNEYIFIPIEPILAIFDINF